MSDQNQPDIGQRDAGPEGAPPSVGIVPKSPEAVARQRAGRRRGGQNPRAAALIGLGGPLPVVSMRTHDERMSVLEAVAAAVAAGRTSGLTAQVLLAAVREARSEANDALEKLVQAQAARLAEIEAGAVVTVRRGLPG
jgi:hypothetical protein